MWTLFQPVEVFYRILILSWPLFQCHELLIHTYTKSDSPELILAYYSLYHNLFFQCEAGPMVVSIFFAPYPQFTCWILQSGNNTLVHMGTWVVHLNMLNAADIAITHHCARDWRLQKNFEFVGYLLQMESRLRSHRCHWLEKEKKSIKMWHYLKFSIISFIH